MLHPHDPSLRPASALLVPHGGGAHPQRDRSRTRDEMPSCQALLQSLLTSVDRVRWAQLDLHMLSQESYQDPAKLLNRLDPSCLRPVLTKWQKEFKDDLNHLLTALDLQHKYANVDGRGAVMRQFQGEASRKWQFPKLYANSAQPAEIEGQFPAVEDEEMDYSVDKAWQRMRERHAKECHAFIVQHNAAAV